jgi:uncharacterized protein YodC (DUF2158 family)
MSKFKIGDVCFLKGGSCALTVIALLGDNDVEIMWFTDMNEGQRAVLCEGALLTDNEAASQQEFLSATVPTGRCQ